MKHLFSPSPIEMFPEPVLGIVEAALAPHQRGRVKCQNSHWPAKLYQVECLVTISPGQPVKVVGIEGITLLVVPIGCQKPFYCRSRQICQQSVRQDRSF